MNGSCFLQAMVAADHLVSNTPDTGVRYGGCFPTLTQSFKNLFFFLALTLLPLVLGCFPSPVVYDLARSF